MGNKLYDELNEVMSKIQRVPVKMPDEPLTADDWNSLASNFVHLTQAVEAVKNNPPPPVPRGFSYFRFPGMVVPWGEDGMYPDTVKSQWYAIHSIIGGAFMRLAGGNASAFSTNGQVKYDEKAGGSGGGQHWAIARHGHEGLGHELGGGRVDCNNYGWYLACQAGEHKNPSASGTYSNFDIECRPENITIEVYVFRG